MGQTMESTLMDWWTKRYSLVEVIVYCHLFLLGHYIGKALYYGLG